MAERSTSSATSRADPLGERLALHQRRGHGATDLGSPRALAPEERRALDRARRRRWASTDGLVTSVDLEPFASAAESLVGVAVIPVSACAGRDRARRVRAATTAARRRDRPRDGDRARAARAHRGRADRVDDARLRPPPGTVRTYVLADRITRASCFVCADAARRDRARALARGRAAGDARRGSQSSDDPSLSPRARLREVKTHVVGPMCHVLWAWTTGDAVGPNMMTRNSYALNMGYVMQRAPVKPERAILEANMGGDKKPSVRVLPVGSRQDGDRGGVPLRRADPPRAAHDRERPRGALLGRHARRGRVRHAVGRVHARVRGRRRLRRHRPGPRHGRHQLDGARHARRVEGGLQASIRFRGLEVGTVGGGTTLPVGPRLARLDRLRRPRQGLPLRPDRRGGRALPRDQRLGRDGHRRQRELLPGAPRTGRAR